MNLFKKSIILIILLVFFADLLDSKKKKKDDKKNNKINSTTKNDKKKKNKYVTTKKHGRKLCKKPVTKSTKKPSNKSCGKPSKPNKSSRPSKPVKPGKKPNKTSKPVKTEIVTTKRPETTPVIKPEVKPNITEITFPVYYCIYLKNGETYSPLKGINRTVLKEAIKQLEARMCLSFIEQIPCKNDSAFPNPLILLIDDLGTYINQYNFTYPIKFTNPYEIKIQASCNRKVGCFLKKILAYLGFYLTHRRKDRDSYITVNDSNILTGYEWEFEKISNDMDYNVAGYDFGSVMHISKFYRRNYLRGDPFKTKFSLSYESMVGQEYGLSFSDYKILNYRYCREKCLNTLSCKNGGFQNPEGCKYCECPNGYKGNLCEELEDSTGECGETRLNATSAPQSLFIKGRGTCNILITASDHKRINITVIKASLGAAYPCFEKKGLEIKHRSDKSVTGLCACTYAENEVVQSEDNTVFVQYNGFIQNHYANITYHEIN
uniref:Metalloendopeptidase n=1 Tax=Strongyloides venezuelensis TaxID=75913 RepID=A0A0K0EXN9_STRVS